MGNLATPKTPKTPVLGAPIRRKRRPPYKGGLFGVEIFGEPQTALISACCATAPTKFTSPYFYLPTVYRKAAP
jgi:hypothetical protein